MPSNKPINITSENFYDENMVNNHINSKSDKMYDLKNNKENQWKFTKENEYQTNEKEKKVDSENITSTIHEINKTLENKNKKL